VITGWGAVFVDVIVAWSFVVLVGNLAKEGGKMSTQSSPNAVTPSGPWVAAAAAWAALDPQLKSVITSVLMLGAGAIATWFAKSGIISANDIPAFTAWLVAAMGTFGAFVILWWKARANSQAAMMKAINAAPNGASVVPEDAAAKAGIQPINAPVK